MKKVKMIGVFFMLFVIMMVTSGCSTQTELNMDTKGKGNVAIKLEIPKDAIENSGYTKAKTPEELVNCLKERCSKTINLEFSVDKESSSENDYIIASLSFESIDEFNAQIDEVIKQYNMMVVASDFEGLFGYIPSMTNSTVYETEAVKKYFEENGIKVNTDDRNVRKFVKLVKSCLVFDDETIEGDERLRSAFKKDVPSSDNKFEIQKTVEISESNGDKELKIQKLAFDCVKMYMQRLLIKYQTDIFDLQNIMASTESVSGMETKEILEWTFDGIGLADKVKAVLDEKGANGYNLADVTPFMAVQLFNDELVQEFQMCWNREYNNYQEEKRLEKAQAEGFENLETAVYKDRNTLVKFTFGENIVEFSDDEFLDAYADNRYIAISSKNTGTYEPTGTIDYESYDNKCDNDSQNDNNQGNENNQCNQDNENQDNQGEDGQINDDQNRDDCDIDDSSAEVIEKINTTKNNENESTPKTGDVSLLAEVGIIGMISLAIAVILLKKRRTV